MEHKVTYDEKITVYSKNNNNNDGVFPVNHTILVRSRRKMNLHSHLYGECRVNIYPFKGSVWQMKMVHAK